MGKSVYSMVLTDGVISRIDMEAMRCGKSRSQLINDILAAYVGYDTAKSRVEEILSILSGVESGISFRIVRNQQHTIDFLSSINYKYSPRVTYSVELFTEDDESGYLKIALRTTNSVLLSIIADFFNNFIMLEEKYLGNATYRIVDGKLVRKLNFENLSSAQEIALNLAAYVNNIDKMINLYINDYFSGYAEINLERNYLIIKDDIKF